MKQRDTYIDVAKGLAMLSIIRIHTECMGPLGVPYPIIAVPLFFFISGFYDRSERPLRQWLPKAFKSLIVTSIVWDVIGYSYKMLIQFIKDGNPDLGGIIDDPLYGNGAIWFLVALFFAKIIIGIFENVHLPQILVYLFFVIIAWVSSFFHPYDIVDNVLTALPLYYGGKLLYPYISKIIENKILVMCGSFSLLYIWRFNFPYTLVELSGNVNSVFYPLYLSATFMTFIPCFFVAKKLQKWKWMADYGTKTLGILVIHPLMLHTCAIIFNRVFVPETICWYVCFLVAYIVVCVLCYYVTVWIDRYCPVLLGKY